MKPEEWRRVREAFEHAVVLAGDERAAWLDGTLGADGALRSEVERLLSEEEPEDTFLESPLSDTASDATGGGAPSAPRPFVGRRFGSFRIDRLIAAGGMGAVYEAEQETPRRRVALKTMHTGLGSETARRRFDDEVDLLARLRHPAIAQIHDAGVRVEGEGASRLETPWFAMELVEGARSVVAFAEEEGLGVKERLELFRAICAGVHHGHQMGVIHRDLKPANLLVDRDGRPKVIDFGVARAMHRDPAADGRTREGEFVGTLVAMSPEQIAGRGDVDLRADVYSLGVVLYELLAGRPPFDVSGLSITQAGRRLVEDEPPPPSRHRPDLPRDLDWIVAKAMRKERERRYGSVAELSEDLARFLRHDPVSAGPPGTLYPLRKFVRRHRTAVTAAALLLLAVVGGLIGTSLGLVRAREAELASKDAEAGAREAESVAREAEAQAQTERAAALTEARRAKAVTDFLVDVLGSPHPAIDGRDVRVADALERASELYAVRFADSPAIRAQLAGTLGAVYRGLGLAEEAEVEHRAALELLRAAHPDGTSDTARELRRLGQVLTETGRLDEARAVLDEAVTMELALGGGVGLHRARAQLGRLLLARAELATAETVLRSAVEGLEATVGADAKETLLAVNSLAGVMHQGARYVEAERLYTRALEGLREVVPAENPDLVRVRFNLAMLAFARGDARGAIETVSEVIHVYDRVLGTHHPDTLLAYSNLGGMLQLSGRSDEAAPLYETAIERARDALSPDHPVTLTMSVNLAMLLEERGDLDGCEELLLRVYDVRRDTVGEGNESTLRTLFDLAELAWARGEVDAALERAESGLQLAVQNLGTTHYFVYRYRLLLARFLVDRERFAEAEPLLLACHDTRDRVHSSPTPLVAPEPLLRELYERWDRPEEAERWAADE